MRARTTAGARRAHLASWVAALVLAGGLGACGDSGDSDDLGGPNGSPTATATAEADASATPGNGQDEDDPAPAGGTCEPVVSGGPTEAAGTTVAQGEPLRVDLSETSGEGAEVEIAVQGIDRTPTIPRGKKKRGFTARQFAVVIYRVRNVGSSNVETNDINRLFALAQDEQRVLSVDRIEACQSAAMEYARASRRDLTSPQTILQTEEQATTVSVYAVPKGFRPARWVSDRLDAAVRLDQS